MSKNNQKAYQTPSLTVYGAAEEITAQQNSLGSDNSDTGGSDTTSAYSVPPQ